MSQGSQ